MPSLRWILSTGKVKWRNQVTENDSFLDGLL